MSKKQQNLQDYLNQFQEQIQIHIHRLTPEKQLNILHHMLNDFLYPLPTKLKCTPTSIPETYRKIILHYIITITKTCSFQAYRMDYTLFMNRWCTIVKEHISNGLQISETK